MAKRLPPQPNEWINRDKTVGFTFEKHHYRAFEGDVVTSALLAADTVHLARSFKYHRPRGILSFANHDANVMLHSDDRTNIRADIEPVSEGASYKAVNTIGGLKYDITQSLQIFSRFLPVGFYYKAFYRPRWMFPYWEKLIRNLAGLGKINQNFPTTRHRKYYQAADLLIVGGGPAGIAAAEKAAALGLQTVLVEEGGRLGGSYDYLHADDDLQLRKQKFDNIQNNPLITIHCDTYAAGYYDDGYIPLVSPNKLIHLHAGAVIFATGLMEQPAVFRNNDVPGVMLASAAQRLAHRYAVQPFNTGVVFTSNAAGYLAALDLVRVGADIDTIVDTGDPNTRLSSGVEGQKNLANLAISAGITVIPHSHVCAAQAKANRLNGITIRSDRTNTEQHIACDGLLMSMGWAPNAALLYQAGGKLTYDETLEQIRPHELPAGVYSAGRINGYFDLADQQRDAQAAAEEAAIHLGKLADQTASRPITHRPVTQRPAAPTTALSHPLPIFPHGDGKEFIDLDEDITIADIDVAYREGFDSIELMKRFSTIGMGPSQGKTSNMNGVRLLAHHRDEPVGVIGVTTPRPFLHPVPMGTLAGRRMRRHWSTPMQEFHDSHQGQMMEAGTWLRPMNYGNYPRAGKLQSNLAREYEAVRNRVGLIDVSTLGKIELFGPDVIPLMEYAYTAAFGKLKTGMTRYIFMVDGTGTLTDDGVAARFSDDHFYITATSSHAQAVVRQLQLNADQLNLNVSIADRTFQMAAMNLAGPSSREVLAQLTELDLSDDAFPYLAVREASVAGVTATIMRVGFVGELGYEIHCPANSAVSVWDSIMAAGRSNEILPFGVETQRLLRLEKGHLIFGQDTDGTTNPFEVNLGWGVGLSKPRFNGKHSLAILKPRLARKLVGFKTTGSDSTPIEECHLVIANGEIVGRVTSVSYSPHCDAVIGLAVVPLELTEVGNTIRIRTTDGTLIEAAVVSTAFYDPDNLRQKPAVSSQEQSAQDKSTQDQQAQAGAGGMSRRSPIAEPSIKRHAGLSLGEVSNMTTVATSAYTPQQNFLCDLSAIRKRLVIGQDAPRWLTEHTGQCPDTLFETRSLEGGAFIVRMHRDQYVVVDGNDTESYNALFTLPTGRQGLVLLLEYECAEMVLAGPNVAEIVSELCPMPMQDIAAGYWCATRMAHADVIMLPVDSPSRHYRILTTPADARFVYDTFSEAIEECGGGQIGYEDYWQEFLA